MASASSVKPGRRISALKACAITAAATALLLIAACGDSGPTQAQRTDSGPTLAEQQQAAEAKATAEAKVTVDHYDTVISADHSALVRSLDIAQNACLSLTEGAMCVATSDSLATQMANVQHDFAALVVPRCYSGIAPELDAWLATAAQVAAAWKRAGQAEIVYGRAESGTMARSNAAGVAIDLLDQANIPFAQSADHWQRALSLKAQATCP